MRLSKASLTILPLLLLQVQAALNDPCDAAGIPGICIKETTCEFTSGTARTGFCPNDPDDVKCCTTKCGPSAAGTCQFNSTCASGETLTGELLPVVWKGE